MLYRLETLLSALFIAAAALALMVLATVNVLASTLDEAAAATFKLWNGERAICSAVYIGRSDDGNNDYFLTAAHCVERGKDTFNVRAEVLDDQFRILKQTTYFVDVQRDMDSKDVALLRTVVPLDAVPAPGDIAAPGEFSGRIGEPVVAIGYPFADALALTTGVFTGAVPGILRLDSPLHRATPAIAGGSSGGGLWAEIGGEWKIIGLATAMRRGTEFVNYFSTPEKIADLLRFHRQFEVNP